MKKTGKLTQHTFSSANYFCIQGWMVIELKLRNTELMLMGILYGLTQDGEPKRITIRYFSKALGCTSGAVYSALNSLLDKGLVKRDSYTFEETQKIDFMTYNVDHDKIADIREKYKNCSKFGTPDVQNPEQVFENQCSECGTPLVQNSEHLHAVTCSKFRTLNNISNIKGNINSVLDFPDENEVEEKVIPEAAIIGEEKKEKPPVPPPPLSEEKSDFVEIGKNAMPFDECIKFIASYDRAAYKFRSSYLNPNEGEFVLSVEYFVKAYSNPKYNDKHSMAQHYINWVKHWDRFRDEEINKQKTNLNGKQGFNNSSGSTISGTSKQRVEALKNW